MHSLDKSIQHRSTWTVRKVVPAALLGSAPIDALIGIADHLAKTLNSLLDKEVTRIPHEPGTSIVASFQGNPSLLASWHDEMQFGEIILSTGEKSLCQTMSIIANRIVPHLSITEILQIVKNADDERQLETGLMMLFYAADNGEKFEKDVAQVIISAWNERPDTFRREMIWAISGLVAYWPVIVPLLSQSIQSGLPDDLESAARTVIQLVEIELDLPSAIGQDTSEIEWDGK